MITTTDNNCGNLKIDVLHADNFQTIANISIKTQLERSPNLLIFPHCIEQSKDKIKDDNIFTLHGTTLTTGNIVGFVGVNGSEIKIQSRFDKDGPDYFLHYMLQKVFNINMFDLKHSIDNQSVFDFVLYLFPYYLKKALQQGLFKEYQHKKYNNANVRGAIDVQRHIRNNVPFAGKIAYSVKEYSYDNHITQLIRHTIEHIQQHPFGQTFFQNDFEVQNCIMQIKSATPTYNKNYRHKVLHDNLKVVSHPYFFEYRTLQKICNQILRYEGLKYGREKDKVYGVLFDGAWLWEEYINTILSKQEFIHPENKTGKNPDYIFRNPRTKQYFPDFYKENIVVDAKYKTLPQSHGDISRDDLYQLISYMYVRKAALGGFIYPRSENIIENGTLPAELNGYGGHVKIWSVPITENAADFLDFSKKMQINEEHIKII